MAGSQKAELRTALAAFAFGLVLVVALAAFFGVSWGDVTQAVRRAPLAAWIVIPAAQSALIIFSAWKWHLLLTSTGDGSSGLHLRHATAATGLGTLAGQVLPLQFVTPAIRAWTARQHGITVSRAVGTSVFEQLFEVIVLLSMVVAGLLAAVIGTAFGLAAGVGFLLCLSLTITSALRFSATVLGSVARDAIPFLSRLARGLREAQNLPPSLLMKLLGLSILRYALLVWLNVQIFAWLVPGIPLLPLALAFPIVQAVTALPLVTGGLGLTEATWISLLVASGLAAPEAAAAALASRVISTAGFLLACPFLVAFGMSRNRGPA